MPKMKIALLSICLFSNSIFSELGKEQYSKSGTFEIASGLSGALSSNSSAGQTYQIALLPYANHFIFNKIFLRYDLGLALYTTISTFGGSNLQIWPGVAAGYSFQLGEAWFLNLSAGPMVVYTFPFGYSYATRSDGNIYVAFHPELKYFVSEKWSISLAMRILTNIPDLIYDNRNGGSVLTNTYISAAYSF